jgi:hypothetical protein
MLNKIKYLLKNLIAVLPGQGWWLITAYRKLGLLKRRALVKYRSLSNNDSLPSSEHVYWIDPQRVNNHTNYLNNDNSKPFSDRVFNPVLDKGKVYGGNWDISTNKFSDLEIYRALDARINNAVEWKNTDYYQDMLMRIAEGEGLWGCQSKEDLEKRCSYLDDLIHSIKQKGYKLNHAITLESEDADLCSKDGKLSEEVSVNIGRKGEYLFQDGRHRLAIAQILGIKIIPVKVLVRHKQWNEFRQFIYSMTEGVGGASKDGALYQIAIHPDLSDIPASHGCEDRFNAIKKNLTERQGSLLDVGTNLGYFCHKFEDIGFECIAIEYSPDIAIAAEKLRESEGKTFKVITGDLYDVAYKPPLKDNKFNVVLLLSVIHHSLKKKEDYILLKNWLKTLDTDEIFFEPHNPDEIQMQAAYKNYNESEFVQFILDNTSLNNATMIHKCDDGRNIYKLNK